VHLSRGTLRVYPGPLDATATAPGSTLQRLVLAWYRERACQVFAHRLAVLRRDPRIAALGRPGTLGVRRMRRRWGSCFRDGRITLNIELLAEPLPLVDYVIVHELCHLREHNHSPRFYRLMDEVMPDWRTRREALRRSTTAGFLAGP
jgi:predicted metal-dependent hydrolase